MGTVGPAYHKFQLMTASPMFLAIRWAHKHTTVYLVHQCSVTLSHVAASFGSRTGQQLRPNSYHILSLPRANGVSFPKILLKISQMLHGRRMYHIDYLADHKVCLERH